MKRLDPATTIADPDDLSVRPLGSRFGGGRTVRAYVLLTHPLPLAIVMATTAAFAVLFAGGLPPLPVGGALLLAMLGGQLAIGAVNELVDVELDAATKPWKPIPSGMVSQRGAWTVVALGLGMMGVFGAALGGAALLLLVLGTGLGLAYDLWLKRTAWSWLPYVLALPLLPVWVRTAVLGFDARLLLLFPLGMGAVAAVHLAQALPDCDGDRAAGLRNPVSRLGEKRSLTAACRLAASAPAAAIAVMVAIPGAGVRTGIVLVAAGIALGLIVAVAALYRRRRSLGVRAAFPCLATATVLVALGWVLGAS